MKAIPLLARYPASVAPPPSQGSAPTLTFSMLCCVPPNIENVAVRIMWGTVRIILLHMRTRRISAT